MMHDQSLTSEQRDAKCNHSPHDQTFHIGSIVSFHRLHAEFILISAAFDEPV